MVQSKEASSDDVPDWNNGIGLIEIDNGGRCRCRIAGVSTIDTRIWITSGKQLYVLYCRAKVWMLSFQEWGSMDRSQEWESGSQE